MAPGVRPQDEIEAAEKSALESISGAEKNALNSIGYREKVFAERVGKEQQLRWLHDGFCQQIASEYDLIGVRMGWLMASTAFLFTALAFTSARLADSTVHSPVLQTLMKLIPLLGLSLTLVVLVGILAAEFVICRRKNDRLKIENELISIFRLSNADLISQIERNRFFRDRTVRITVPTTSPRHWFGLISTLAVWALIFSAWFCVSCSVYRLDTCRSCGLCTHLPATYLIAAPSCPAVKTPVE